ncbi:DUF2189 domain-containing protein [Sedimenticola sp.]|uniref:DUF2189 domain-containing protein n=1 Tax=Sedimenticola sp. TaxID=1940285 RepID=UPI003D0ADC8D
MTLNQNTAVGMNLPVSLPPVSTVTLDHPWRWIAAGWQDFKAAPGISLAYGIIFLLASFLLSLLVVSIDMTFFIPALAAGFFLISPLLAMGLYDVSRALELGDKPSVFGSLTAWQRTPYNLLAMGVILTLAFLIWMLLANMVFAIFYVGLTPDFNNALDVLFLSGDSPLFMAAGILSGSVIALSVFCISVISVPMIMDRNADVMSAVITSVRCVLNNPKPLLLWAALIVMFVGLGLVTLFIGLVLFMPLVGHASWHAYRDLVQSSPSV